jgi:hypothetical protein
MEMTVWRHGPGGSRNQAVTEVPPPARMSVIPMAVATDRRIVGPLAALDIARTELSQSEFASGDHS